MEDPANALISGWSLGTSYLPLVLGLALGVRTFMSLLRAVERPAGNQYLWIAGLLFLGRGLPAPHGGQQDLVPDYWHPFILGLFELMAYPVLMATGNWRFVGAWLAFKTLAQWKHWAKYRVAFNRFLIGNALVLFCSFLFLAPRVCLTELR